MIIASPILLGIMLLLTVGALAIGLLRRVIIPRRAAGCVLVGMTMLALAAGGLSVRWPDPRQAVVMIDLSPSTRTAGYRDEAAREGRIRELLGDVRYTIQTFADGEQVERTNFTPPSADAIVLFSDAQFDLPAAAPPIYAVIDANLEHPADGAVARLEARGEEIVATIRNGGQSREIQFSGAGAGPTTAPAGNPVLTAKLDPAAAMISARLIPGDPWPENDSLSMRPPSRRQYETWWIDSTSWPANYRAMRPAEIPTDAAVYLQASVIVLNNIPASALSPVQQERLMQFVRDLGGGLVILGGEQAFGAGGYLGTPLETLSPLASAPAQPQRNWIILADSSGSMAGPADGATRWQRAAGAITQLLGALPPNDPVSVGSFARDLRWWSQGQRAADAAQLPFPPQDIVPSGPTNLQAVLTSLATQIRGNAVTEIVILSDADALIDDPPAISNALNSVRASVNLLLTGQTPRAPVMQVVALTFGNMIPQADPKLWAADAVKLARSTMRDWVERRTARVNFAGSLESQPSRDVPLWNRTWIKPGATELAWMTENNARIVLAGQWRLGAGQVAAAGFAATGTEVEALAKLVEQAPRDPRFKVTHVTGTNLEIEVDAANEQNQLNDLDVTVTLINESESYREPITQKLTQTGPGQYEVSILASRIAMLAVIRAGDQIIDRFAVAGRYAPEFENIGNDRPVMRELASRTGGAIIEPSQTTPIDFRWPPRTISLVSPLAAVGAAFIGLGLIVWKAAR